MKEISCNGWRNFEELRPDQLAAYVTHKPIVFWPLGLLEHHGWHLPVGFDGLKARQLCIKAAEHTGGVLLPTMWWGGRGGHGKFHWTLYQQESAYTAILVDTVEKLIQFEFRVIVILAGHYPWQSTLDRLLPDIQKQNPDVLLLWGTEIAIGSKTTILKGDHAARDETSIGLWLFPERVNLNALTEGRGLEAWPKGQPPSPDTQHPQVEHDPDNPLFAQMGDDARLSSAEYAEEDMQQLINELVSRIRRHLDG